jgi:UDP-2,3-diacylglucosamine pyrophosphatase LpxH
VIETIPADQPIWFVSDLHLGDGTPSDVFFGKDRHLIALIERADAEGACVVVVGDAIDFHQAWSFIRVLRAHKALLAAMSAMGRQGRLYYVIGNHDYDITLFSDVLNFKVCDELRVAETILVRHGYEYDPFVSEILESGQWATKIHHVIERYLATWLRIPLGEFYTLPNRLLFWIAHKLGVAALVARRFGMEDFANEVVANLDFWAWSNQGDSMGIFRPAFTEARTGKYRVVVCGHSHLPGVVRDGDRIYGNTGSWTFASSQYLVWDGHDIRCFDWITGREYRDELYQTMIDGSLYEHDFFQWWRENYMGWLRYREGEERRGSLRGWERYIRDREHLSQLRPIPDTAPVADAPEFPASDPPPPEPSEVSP